MSKCISKSLIIIITFANCYLAAANENSPFQALRYNQSARSAGLAGNFVQMTNDASAVFQNPATITTVTEKKFSATFFKHILDINSGLASYVFNGNDYETIAVGVAYTNYGSFDASDILGNRTGTFSANDITMSASYANQIDTNLYYGVSAKLLYMGIDNVYSMAFAFDAGLLYMIPDKRTNIGFSILHAGAQFVTFDGVDEGLPLDVRIGVNHRLRGLPLLVNLSFHHLADSHDSFFERFTNFSLAGELYLGEYIRARLGYDNGIRSETSPSNDRKLSGFSGGLGVVLKDVLIDYGAAQIGTAAMLHRFSIGIEF